VKNRIEEGIRIEEGEKRNAARKDKR